MSAVMAPGDGGPYAVAGQGGEIAEEVPEALDGQVVGEVGIRLALRLRDR